MDEKKAAGDPHPLAAPVAQPRSEFVLHSINNYTNILLSSMTDALDLDSRDIATVIRQLHDAATRILRRRGLRYDDLRWALTPRTSHAEIAFVFDATATGSDSYGPEIMKTCLPALEAHGPKRTAISRGDLVGMPSDWTHRELERLLVRTGDIPARATNEYFVVYFTNMSPTQTAAMESTLRKSPAFIGYLDCSTWTPLKAWMLLPQFAIRVDNKLIVSTDEDGTPHDRFPDGTKGFELVGVEDTTYGVVLSHRIDNGVPEWADDDSKLTLAAIGGSGLPLRTLELDFDQRRLDHLTSDEAHGASFERAGLKGLPREAVIGAIKAKIPAGLVFNLRFTRGTRNGEPAPENDAFMFTVQVEFPDAAATVRRYQVGIKYQPIKHRGEVVTFH